MSEDGMSGDDILGDELSGSRSIEPLLLCSNVPVFQCSWFQCSTEPMFLCSNVPVFQCSCIPMFH